MAAVVFIISACSAELETGKSYPVLELGDAAVEYKLEKVMQNTENVMPYFTFFKDIKLKLTYRDSKPYSLSFTENGVPFRVTDVDYDGVLDSEWEIDNSSYPYAVKIKGTDKIVCYISQDRNITIPFRLGAPSNKYEYQFVKVENSTNE